MKATANPWMKFYPQDWRADEQLRMCSLGARGLWIEMLSIMHRSARYGYLLIGGKAPTDAQIAMQVGAFPDEVSALILELETSGVSSRTSDGIIYSRRMVRDHKKAETARKNGKKGGNPKLSSDNPEDNPEDKADVITPLILEDNPADKGGDKPQIPEARSQSSVTNVTAAEAAPDDPVKAIFEIGVALLTVGSRKATQARSVIGKWRKDHGDAATLAAIVAARDHGPSEPVEWINGRFRAVGEQEDASRALSRATAERYRQMDMPGPPPGFFGKH